MHKYRLMWSKLKREFIISFSNLPSLPYLSFSFMNLKISRQYCHVAILGICTQTEVHNPSYIINLTALFFNEIRRKSQ